MALERKSINWKKLREKRKPRDYGVVPRETKSLVKTLTNEAKAKSGLIPRNHVETLVFLGHTKTSALKPLIDIYITTGFDKDKATQIAKSQINMLWDAAVRRKATLIKFSGERAKQIVKK